jgi:site-specific recombinase XerD
MGVNIWVNKGRLYLDVYMHGKRRREILEGLIITGNKTIDKETMRLAEIARAIRAQKVFSEEWGLVDTVAGKQSLYEYIDGMANKSPIQKAALKHLKKFKGGFSQIGQIDEKWIEDFQNYLSANNLSSGSANAYSGAVRSALNQAVKDKIILTNPSKNVKRIKVPKSNRVWLNEYELQLLIKTPLDGAVGKEIRRAFLFGCFTGLRISDIKSLIWGEIERSPLQIVKQQKKTKESVYIPLNETSWEIINDKAIHDHREPVFPLLMGKTRYNQQLIRWAKKAGIDKRIGWHTARHTFAVMTLEAGADLYTVSKLLGHTDIKTTQIYAKVTDKLKRAAVEALPKIEISR